MQRDGQVDSVVPLLSLKTGSIQAAVNEASKMVENSIRQLDDAERQILDRYSGEPLSHDQLKSFITSCKYACTGNLNWR